MSDTRKFFYVGERYRVRKDFQAGAFFCKGEILIFEGDLFSPRDEAQSYQFRGEDNGTQKYWLLREDDPLELRQEYFERVDASSTT
jgi:hypothetical protein